MPAHAAITLQIENFLRVNERDPSAVANLDRAIVAAGGLPGILDTNAHTYTVLIVDSALTAELLMAVFLRHGFRTRVR